MIVLRPWTNEHTFVVVVVLITNIPIQSAVQLDCQPRFRRLKTHRIGTDEESGIARRIGEARSLPIVLVDSIAEVKSRPRGQSAHTIYIEEIVPHVVQASTLRMLDAVKEVIYDGVAVDPVVVVTGIDREPGTDSPIQRRREHSRLDADAEILQGNARNLGWVCVVSGDQTPG